MIEIRPVHNFDTTDLNRLTGPFTCYDTLRVTYADSDNLTNFHLELLPLEQPFVNRYDHLNEEYIRTYFAQADFSFGAYDGDQLVGVLIAERRDWNDSLWVWEFHVDEKRRGQGIGRLLMEYTAQKAREAGLRIIECETQNQNTNAIKAYRKLGFRLEGIDISYYSNTDYPDRGIAVFMKRRLDG